MSPKINQTKTVISELKSFLDEKVQHYNNPEFIVSDPVSIPHRYTLKEDREISGFLAATIAWGQRPVILRNSEKLMLLMDNEPHQFLLHAGKKEFARFRDFVHRTFNGSDCIYLLKALQHCYRNEGGLEQIFTDAVKDTSGNMAIAISNVRSVLFSYHPPGRSSKHVSDPMNNASAKRINMYLRWMVRKDKCGVDFGIWKKIKPSVLCCPLDVHSGRVARKLGLLNRSQNDWKAVEELTMNLRNLDPEDPVKYDFALFGLGVEEQF
jgi:uncharacterized protein (TIGR02757 family)